MLSTHLNAFGSIYRSGAIKMEEVSDHLVNKSECVEADGSFKYEKEFQEDFMHPKTS
ncbi:hypothetical protein DY000_02024709 [Brassica cretica]|uniref:Uncharacterized protein n=1 Tax=Brassica cretica TaxID=69181 RepID=A0ABQ7E7K2_BRACR|nr:hypothetical protein DY000_02024709 [Brassica cretica]